MNRRFSNAEPLARGSDHWTSHAAAEAFTESGKRDSIKARLFDHMRRAGINTDETARTYHEIARTSGLPEAQVWRRLPDLRHDGLVRNGPDRRCTITDRVLQTWRLRRIGNWRAK